MPLPDAELPPFLTSEGLPAEASVAILPVPYERTTSWGRGAEHGPAALLRASRYVELYDEELRLEPFRIGIETLPPVDVETSEDAALQRISASARAVIERGRFLAAIGGEHTVTPALVRGVMEAAGADLGTDLGLVQFDAHADLRPSYQGTRWNHACAMSRVLDLGVHTLAVGIRSLSRPEAVRIETERLPIIWGHQMQALDPEDLQALFAGLLASLPDTVYLTFDLDFFDPSLLPATGTPEPGGGNWFQALTLLRLLFEQKRVIAMDIVELAPIPDNAASEFTAARLLYKCIGYRYRQTLAAAQRPIRPPAT
ncbi:MAG: agmatinase [Acidobacteria bacterium]|nr:agmatinase [Acidobacteriota bacterium]